MSDWLKTLTKLTYIACLVALIIIPSLVWAYKELWTDASANMAGMGAFIAGSGVPLGALTAAMAASSIAKKKQENGR